MTSRARSWPQPAPAPSCPTAWQQTQHQPRTCPASKATSSKAIPHASPQTYLLRGAAQQQQAPMTAAPSALKHSMLAAPDSFADRQASHSCPGVCLLQEQACAAAVLAWLALQDSQHPPQLRCSAGGAADSQQRRQLSQQQPKQHLPPRNPAALPRAFLHQRGQPSGISHRSRGQDLARALATAAAGVVVQPAWGGVQKHQHQDMPPSQTSAAQQPSNQVCC